MKKIVKVVNFVVVEGLQHWFILRSNDVYNKFNRPSKKTYLHVKEEGNNRINYKVECNQTMG
jgi:hypothetical protein